MGSYPAKFSTQMSKGFGEARRYPQASNMALVDIFGLFARININNIRIQTR